MVYYLSLFLFAYAVLAVFTALMIGILTFFFRGLEPYNKKDWNNLIVLPLVLGIVGGAIFPYVWYQTLHRKLYRE